MAKLKINRGTTYRRSITFQIDGVATSLVGATIRFTMKSAEYDADTDDSTALLIKNVTDGNADGEAVILFEPADTASLAPSTAQSPYYYDTKVELANGEIYKIDEGTVILDASPTNRLT